MSNKQGRLVIYRSVNGRDNWQPIGEFDVPEWVKQPDVMGRLVAGEQCMDPTEGSRGSAWYRAVRVVSWYEREMVRGALSTIH